MFRQISNLEGTPKPLTTTWAASGLDCGKSSGRIPELMEAMQVFHNLLSRPDRTLEVCSRRHLHIYFVIEVFQL